MADFAKIFLFSLLTVVEVTNCWFADDPGWVAELKEVCKGAPEHWYVDRTTPLCCKCAKCINFSDQVMPECSASAQCVTKSRLDCVHYENKEKIKQIFGAPNQTSTQVTTTKKSKVVVPHSAVMTSARFSFTSNPFLRDRKVSDAGAGDSIPLKWVLMITAMFVALLVALCCAWLCISGKCEKSPFSFCVLSKKLLSRSEYPDDSGVKKTKGSDGREEEEGLISEKSDCGNQAPPPRQLSESGPPGMCGDMGMNVTRACDGNSGFRSCDPSLSGLPMSTGPLVQTPSGNFEGRDTRPLHESCGPVPIILTQANNNATINIQNLNFCPSAHNAQGQHWPNHNYSSGGRASYEAPIGRGSRLENVASQSYTTPRACFPTQANDGEVHTSASPPLSRQTTECPGMYRQSSEISSASTSGPVENGSASGVTDSKWHYSSARADQQQEYACHQVTQSTHSGPVQHSNTSEKSFHSSEIQHQLSCEESYACSPQSDVGPNDVCTSSC